MRDKGLCKCLRGEKCFACVLNIKTLFWVFYVFCDPKIFPEIK